MVQWTRRHFPALTAGSVVTQWFAVAMLLVTPVPAQGSDRNQAAPAELRLNAPLQPPGLLPVQQADFELLKRPRFDGKNQPDKQPPPKVALVSGDSVSGDEALAAVTTTEVLEEKQEQIAAELRVAMLQEKHEAVTSGEEANQPTADASRVDLLKQIDVVIAQQQSATSSNEDHDAQVAALKSTLTRLADGDLSEPPPYSIIYLDALKESVRNARNKLLSAESSVASARAAADTAKQTLEDRAKSVRQLKENAGSVKTPAIELAELEQKLAEEILVLERQELSIEEANLAIAKLQLKIDERKVSIVGDRIVFTKEALGEKLADIDDREIEWKQKALRLQNELQFAERRWLAARQEADSVPNAGPELTERVDSLKVSQMTIQNELSLANQQLQRIPILKKAWERRYLVIANQVQRKERNEWADETEQQIKLIAQDKVARQLKLDELRGSRAAVDAKVDAANENDAEVKRWLRVKQTALDRQTELVRDSVQSLENAQRTLQRLKTQIDGEPGRSFGEIVEDTWLQAKGVWNYELAAIDDNSVTVGKVCSSVLLLFFGFLFARWLSGWLGRRLSKWGIDEAAAGAIESLSFYALLITLGLTALRYANVPLTVFTFLGGAIAIGIGFGSQNILNNFISGLILLAERPIKVGDLIMLDETYGNVTKIGARSTQIRTGDNRDIIVPNSKFLENNVTNLTRRDDRLRTSISIGVAYGSNLDSVLRLLSRAASEQSGVLDRPKPMVWFNDFGDNSLVFQVHFWVQAKNVTQMRMIETGVRLKIDAMFREAEIVIAFPQRDLHIQSPRPIDFRLVASDPAEQNAISKAA